MWAFGAPRREWIGHGPSLLLPATGHEIRQDTSIPGSGRRCTARKPIIPAKSPGCARSDVQPQSMLLSTTFPTWLVPFQAVKPVQHLPPRIGRGLRCTPEAPGRQVQQIQGARALGMGPPSWLRAGSALGFLVNGSPHTAGAQANIGTICFQVRQQAVAAESWPYAQVAWHSSCREATFRWTHSQVVATGYNLHADRNAKQARLQLS